MPSTLARVKVALNDAIPGIGMRRRMKGNTR
eukprot:CAMPEP_0179010346 /NCGR_PEP_ID=MMETSP0796-20121207/59_1 /TAXON_ID=73915 /ORGANISM="Pyrodinium bahamense, Strain pbaha01" /LENGTH=30 /DNA_ID= /DNA_START= /DNA_END= /DNA_ORIENTATION=